MFSYHFDVLMSKIIFKKNIILMCFGIKNTLKSNCYYTSKHLQFDQGALKMLMLKVWPGNTKDDDCMSFAFARM